jgi:hypothetical protein
MKYGVIRRQELPNTIHMILKEEMFVQVKSKVVWLGFTTLDYVVILRYTVKINGSREYSCM